MAQPFYRFQAAAKKAQKPGQKLTFSGGVYRLTGGTKPSSMSENRLKPKPKPRDPFAGLPSYTPPDQAETMAGANRAAQGIYEPLLADIARRYAQQRSEAMARQKATQAATQQAFAAARDPLANVYNSAIGQATTLENAVSNRLKGQGESRGADFAAKLAQMGAPETGAAQELATTYQGADAAGFASGMSDVGRLVSRGAEAKGWLEKQPAIEAQRSQAELMEALNEMLTSENDEVGGITANIPGQVRQLYEQMYGQADDRGKATYEDKWTKIKYLDEQKAEATKNIIIAREMNDKAAEAQARAQAKSIDQEIARTRLEVTMRGQDVTARGQDMTDARARDPKLTTPKTPKVPKITPKYVVDSVWGRVFPGYGNNAGGWSPDLLRKMKGSPKAIDNIVIGAINTQISAFGPGLTPAQKKALRTSILKRLSGKQIPGVGVFRYP